MSPRERGRAHFSPQILTREGRMLYVILKLEISCAWTVFDEIEAVAYMCSRESPITGNGFDVLKSASEIPIGVEWCAQT